jgi:hypothetical protein
MRIACLAMVNAMGETANRMPLALKGKETGYEA